MKKCLFLVIILLLSVVFAVSQDVNDYYRRAVGLRGVALQDTLHEIIKGHQRQTYDDLRYIYALLDTLPNGEIWDIYTDSCHWRPTENHALPLGSGAASECDCMQREHSFCNSWMGGNGASTNPIRNEPFFSDLFQLYPTDGYVNQLRNDNPYGVVSSDETIRTFTNGAKLGRNSYPNAPEVTAYEPVDAYKGDIARSFFYMAVRYKYEDGTFMEDGPMTFRSQLKDWALEMFRSWHLLDPVSEKERNRNEGIYRNWQGNRNPFIDFPELVDLIWGDGIEVFTMEPDTLIRPRVTRCEMVDAATVGIGFDSAMSASSTAVLSYYIIPGNAVSSVGVDSTGGLLLHLAIPLDFGATAYLTLHNLQAAGGTYLRDTVLVLTSGQPAFLGWTFDRIDNADYYVARVLPADYGELQPGARIYFDGSHGSNFFSSSCLQGVTAYGTTIGDPRSDAVAGYSLSFKNFQANGQTFVVAFSTKFYNDISVRFSSSATNTGFNRVQCVWNAVDPSDAEYDHPLGSYEIDSADRANNRFTSHLFSRGVEWNGLDSLFLKITIDGATHLNGNIKFDNICIHGEKCCRERVLLDTVAAGQHYTAYGFDIAIPSSYAGDYVFSHRTPYPDDCDSLVTLLLHVVGGTGIKDVSDRVPAQYRLYPNPAAERVTVSGGWLRAVEVYDVAGRRCLSFPSVAADRLEILLRGLRAGVYVVRIVAGDGTVVQKKLVVRM
ncbi:MAG: endonuclease [Bacteroidales bacterium]|nr:endonuclease [Bacteroidales bacterium]